MYSASITVLLIAVAVIHLIPVKGLLGAEALRTLYQVDVADPNLLILMRHRACLFGVVGLLLIYAAFVREHQWLAVVVGFVSVISFLGIAMTAGGYSEAVRTVVRADIVALVLLTIAALLKILRPV